MAHRIYFPHLSRDSAGVITIAGEEAHHALRVKRLEPGDRVELCDGRGLVARVCLAESRKTREGWEADFEVERVDAVEPVQPRGLVASAVPKGERLEALIDGLSQVGAAEWRPMKTKRSVVDPREGKLGRLERVATEAMKQCGRAWRLEIGSMVRFDEVLSAGVVIADASGGEYTPSGEDAVTILVGPEGGWEPDELEQAVRAGARPARFGPHTMRTELAAVVAVAQVLSAERVLRGRAV